MYGGKSGVGFLQHERVIVFTFGDIIVSRGSIDMDSG